MNCINENIKKILTIVEPDAYLADLYKICLRRVQTGSLVVILTCQKFDISRLSPIKEMRITKEQMKSLIVIYYNSIDEITQKLLDLHEWSLLPALVVVDLAGAIASTMHLKTISLCAASFWDYLHSIVIQSENKCKNITFTLPVYGIFIVTKEKEYFNEMHLEMLRSLYFYRDVMVESVLDIEDFLGSEI